MIGQGARPMRSRMSPTSDSKLAKLQATIDDLQRQLAELKAERDEALEQQTATAEVLAVINSSPGDLGPVFREIVDKAMRLCEATEGALRTFDGELFHLVAIKGDDLEAIEQVQQTGPA